MRKFAILFLLVVFAGCTQQEARPGKGGGFAKEAEMPLRVCAGSVSAEESLAKLNEKGMMVLPLSANGKCLFEYWAKGKKQKENFPVKIWLNPPYEIYMQGDVAFDARGIMFGSNEREFWLAMKPEEVRGYWWGEWAQQSETTGINPRTILEAMGIIETGDLGEWTFGKEDAFDVLTRSVGGRQIEKIYVYSCDSRVYKIEYFDAGGQTVVVTEPSKYREMVSGFFVPTVIRITAFRDGQTRERFRITLESMNLAVFSEKQKARLFSRPKPDGFKNINKIVDSEVVKEEQ